MSVRMKRKVASVSMKILFYVYLRWQKDRFIWSRSVWPLISGLICLLLVLWISDVTYLYLVPVKTEIAEIFFPLCVTESHCLAVT